MANSLAIAGVRFGVLVIDGSGKVLALKKIEVPMKSLSYALEVALSFADVREEDLYSFNLELVPVSSSELKRNALSFNEVGAETFSELRAHGTGPTTKDASSAR